MLSYTSFLICNLADVIRLPQLLKVSFNAHFLLGLLRCCLTKTNSPLGVFAVETAPTYRRLRPSEQKKVLGFDEN